MAVHTLLGILTTALVFPWASQALKLRLIQWWCKRLLSLFNLKVKCTGHVPESGVDYRGCMFVANHISWIDTHALDSVIPLRFIAKAEIKQWPIFGYLVAQANTLFIDRTKKQEAKRTIAVTAKSLNDGDNICFFPEGTTTDGTMLAPFKSSLLQAAIEAQATVWPVVIRYPLPEGGVNTALAYAGDTSLIEAMQQLLRQKEAQVLLHFLPPIPLQPDALIDRRSLTQQVESQIRMVLGL